MIKDREVCLFLTLRCNQKCKYCHRFLGIDDLELNYNEKVIDKIAKDGITNMTFTGGEPLLYSNIIELLKLAKKKGINSKLITNGQILATQPKMREVYNYLDSITLSIDTINNEVNEEMGRGYNHFENIKIVLDSLKGKDLKVNINTVVSKMSIDYIEELGNFLRDYNINAWRIFKFVPLRETAKINREMFDISKAEFRINRPVFTSFPNIKKIEFREENDMENKYVLVMPNGNVVITENEKDVTIGNILKNNLSEILNTRTQRKEPKKANQKIRTLISYNNEKERNAILKKVRELDYVDIIGVSANGIDTYNKIINLKPEMVFANYNMNGMNGLEILQRSKERLKTEMPIFNFITNELPRNEINLLVNVADHKINALISENQKEESIVNTLKEYKKFKE